MKIKLDDNTRYSHAHLAGMTIAQLTRVYNSAYSLNKYTTLNRVGMMAWLSNNGVIDWDCA